MPNIYTSLIAEATGATGLRADAIDDHMRGYTGGVLDSLSRAEFIKLARRCDKELRDPEMLKLVRMNPRFKDLEGP